MAFDIGGAVILEDMFSPTLDRLSKQAKEAEQQLKELGREGDEALAKVKRSGERSSTGFEKLMNVSMMLQGVFFALSSVAASLGSALAALRLGEIALEAQQVQRSFVTMMEAVGQSTGLFEQMMVAAGGTIDQFHLMELASGALVGTHGELSQALARALPQLIEMARAAHKIRPELGSVDFLFTSLVNGIRRSSPLILDNLGLTIKLGEASKNLARQLGKTTDELTAQERTLAILQEVLRNYDRMIEQAGGTLESTTDDLTRARVATQELKIAVGELFAPAVVTAAQGLAQHARAFTAALRPGDVDEFRMALDNAMRELERLESGRPLDPLRAGLLEVFGADKQQAIKGLRSQIVYFATELQRMNMAAEQAGRHTSENLAAIAEATAYISDQFRAGNLSAKAYLNAMTAIATSSKIGTDALMDLIQQAEEGKISWAGLGVAIQTAESAMKPTIRSVRVLGDASMDLAKALEIVGGKSEALQDSLERLKDTGSDLESSFKTVTHRIASLGAAIDPAAAQALFESVTEQLVALEQERTSLTELEYERRKQIILDSLNDQLDAYRNFGREASKVMSNLRSTVESVLKPSFDLEGLAPGLIDESQEQHIDEHYRRLAAIALRGQEEISKHQQDWADTLALIPEDVREQGIGAIQQWAKDMVVAYDKGLDFSLINRNLIKQRILQALQAQQMREEIVNELVGELQGQVDIGQVEAAATAVLGQPLAMPGAVPEQGKQVGQAFLEQFMTTISASDVAGAVAKAWTTDFSQNMEAFKTLGTTTGQTMADAFVDAVVTGAGEVRTRLAELLAPEVAQIMERNRGGGVLP